MPIKIKAKLELQAELQAKLELQCDGEGCGERENENIIGTIEPSTFVELLTDEEMPEFFSVWINEHKEELLLCNECVWRLNFPKNGPWAKMVWVPLR